ncbi:MAG: CAP domain-containing protein [Sandaracinaceae bacterium]|nr:CAP domain-containing protein [Sandaracinaceae bacterium]
MLRCGLVAALLLASCGGQSGDRNTLQGDRYTEVEAPAPSVATYATAAPAGIAVRGVAADDVRAGVEAAAQAHSMPLEADPRLAELAEWIADRLGPDGEPPPNEVVEFFSRHLGLVEPVPHIMVLGQPAGVLRGGIESSVGQFMDRQTYSRWGAAVVERANLRVAVVMLSWRWLELSPIARTSAPGTAVAVQGRLLGDHRNPTIVVQPPDGPVRRLPAGSGPEFDVRVPTSETGVYRVELLGRGAHGDTVIANFPVYVGVPIPSSVRVSEAPASGASDVESVRRDLLDRINATRREAGLAEVQADPAVQAVADAHCHDMVDNDFIGHTSPTTGSALDRVRAAHLPSGLVLENIGRGYSADEIHRGLLESPGHRANLVNADVTHVGIGVVAQAEGTRSAFIVTQVFVRMHGEVDVEQAPAQLLALINASRSARGAPPAELEDNLAAAARDAAREFFEDPSLSQQDAVDDASASLRRFAIAYRRIGGVMAVVNEISEAGALEPTLDPGVRYFGIGVAQGTRDDTGPNAIAVVIVMAWPR